MSGRQEKQSGLIPPTMTPVVFEGFEGINTLSPRPAIQDKQCTIMDGFMPVGPNYARTLPDVGAPIYTSATAGKVAFFNFGNISTNPVMIMFLTDGSVIQVNTLTKVATQMAPAGTIQSPTPVNCGVSQWGSSYIIIVAKQPNGYFLWDGTNFFQSGSLSPSITIQSDGSNYTSNPTITAVGGAGSGASFSVSLQDGSVETLSITNPGSGWGVNDYAVLAFSGGNPAGPITATGSAVISGGSIASVSLINRGALYNASTASVQFLGGGGLGATGSVVVSGGSVSSISITNGGSGFVTSPAVFIFDVDNPVIQAYVGVMPTGLGGTAAETYQGRVWIVNGPNCTFSGPGSLTNFSAPGGGGTFQSTDSFLRASFIQPRQTNGFLYFINDSSVNYISGITTSGEPAITTFTNQNADPEIGSPYAPSVQVFSRNIVFANAFGVHISYGGAVTKISEALDGFYNTLPNFGGLAPSSAKAIIFGQRVYILLLPVIDQVTGQQTNKLVLWNGKVWFTSNQSVQFSFIQSQEINSVLTAYGTDGTSVYPLFQKPSTSFTKTLQSKFFGQPDSILAIKTTERLWGMAYYYANDGVPLKVAIDSEISSYQAALNIEAGILTWVNASGASLPWVNESAQALTWYTAGIGIQIFPPTAIAQNGAVLGFTVSTTASDMAVIFIVLGAEPQAYRG